MDSIIHRHEGRALVEGVDLHAIAKEQGTPLFVYSRKRIAENFAQVDGSLNPWRHRTSYAVKANSTLGVLRLLHELGAHADIVSGGELARCVKAGFHPSEIIFSGVGKTVEELRHALCVGVRAIHAESLPEIDVIARVAQELNLVAPIALRVNPNVDAQTHPYIATGLHNSKFGMEIEVARQAASRAIASPHLKLEGIACHIGSQIGTPLALREAVEIAGRFALECRGLGAPITTVDAGGGWPISYDGETYPPLADFGAAVLQGLWASGLTPDDTDVAIEPGRCIVGNAGILLTEVLFEKQQSPQGKKSHRFVVVDGAMTELLRPSLYDAKHPVVVLQPRDGEATTADVVGPVCESGDFLAKGIQLPPTQRGDLLALDCAGAYAMSMASQYNARLRPPEILIDGNVSTPLRRRETFEDLWLTES